MTGDAPDPLAAVDAAEAALRPALAGQLRSAVDDEAVAERLREWVSGPGLDAGFDDGTAVERAAARQASVLTNHVRYRAAVGDSPPDSLRRTPVSPFAGLDPPSEVESALADLASTLDGAHGTDVSLVGARYAESLSAEERRSRGQFYTPPAVAEWLTRWALDGAEGDDSDGCDGSDGCDRLPRVLDPAAGTGHFPLAAFDRLRERAPEASLDALLSRLVAVDVDEVALHLAALRLSARAGGRPVGAFDCRACSFFDLEPATDGDRPGADRTVPLVDAVVGNPPFVRAGDLSPGRAHFREHLDAFGPAAGAGDGGESPYADGEAALSRRSDAYVYFATQATRFLRPGGRLGLVLPAKWLESDYGAGFRRFLADQYRVRAVVGFGARAFDALVDTVLLLAERRRSPRSGGDDGAGGRVNFVRLEEPLDAAESLADHLEGASVARDGSDAPASGTRPGRDPDRLRERARVVRRSASTFASAETCAPYLRAPEPLLSLLDHPAFVRLGDLARVSRGVTTGANAFFLLDAAERERLGIDGELLRPAVRSIRGVESRTLSPEEVDRWIVDVHDFLADRLDREGVDDARAGDAARRATEALRADGHDALADYVEAAEARGDHGGRTCRSRRVWFDLGDLPTPDAFVPKLLRERVFTVRNEAGAVPTNAIDCLSVREGIDPAVLLGVLDSSLGKALMEVWGRNEAGMLQLMTYETRTLPVPDVRAFDDAQAAAIRAAAADLDADGAGQAALDSAVHDALDVDLSAERARELRDRLLGRRLDGGDRVEAPVS